MNPLNKLFIITLLLLPTATFAQSQISRSSKSSSVRTHNKPVKTVSSTKRSLKGIINGHEYVDLGLASGTKWATCNIGAFSPEEYGNYYAWGETSRKSNYNPDTSITYGEPFDEISSSPQYDAARVNWGGSWRMPTKAECEELLNNCRWTYETKNDVNGYCITGLNGNSIFLPMTGSCDYTSQYDVGSDGLFWSSTPCADNFNGYNNILSYYLGLDNNSCGMHRGNRRYGMAIRPVTK